MTFLWSILAHIHLCSFSSPLSLFLSLRQCDGLSVCFHLFHSHIYSFAPICLASRLSRLCVSFFPQSAVSSDFLSLSLCISFSIYICWRSVLDCWSIFLISSRLLLHTPSLSLCLERHRRVFCRRSFINTAIEALTRFSMSINRSHFTVEITYRVSSDTEKAQERYLYEEGHTH